MLAGTAASRAKDPVNLQFWDMNWAGPEYIDAGKALVEKFNQEHPDIKVTYRTIAVEGLVYDLCDCGRIRHGAGH